MSRLQSRNGCFQSPDDVRQGQIGAALLRQVGHMDKANFGGSSRIVMQQGIERVVADECAGAVGCHRGHTDGTDGGYHFVNRNGGKIGGRAIGDDRLTVGLEACIVSNLAVPDVYGDPLRSHGTAATGLANAKDHIGVVFLRQGKDLLGGLAEDCGDLEFT